MAAFVHTQQTFVGLGGLFKTSPRHALKTSSTHLQRNNFTSSEDEKLLHWRRPQDALNICLEDLLKTYLEDVWKTCVEDVLKTCLGDVLKTLWRQTKNLLGTAVSNKSKCISNKSIFYKSIFDNSKANPNALIRTHHFNTRLILELK